MDKPEIVNAVAEKVDVSREDVSRTIDLALETIDDALERGNDVKLAQLGRLKPSAGNPHHGAKATLFDAGTPFTADDLPQLSADALTYEQRGFIPALKGIKGIFKR